MPGAPGQATASSGHRLALGNSGWESGENDGASVLTEIRVDGGGSIKVLTISKGIGIYVPGAEDH